MSLALTSNHCLALYSSHMSHHSLFPRHTKLFPTCLRIFYLPFCLPTMLNIFSCPPAWWDLSYSSFKSPLGGSLLIPLQHWVRSPNKHMATFLYSTCHTIAQLSANGKNELKQHSNQGNKWETWFRIYSFEIFGNTYNILLIKAIWT